MMSRGQNNQKNLQNLQAQKATKLQVIPFLSEDDRQVILSQGKLVKLNRNRVLFEEGEPANRFYLLLSGSVKLIKKRNDSSNTLLDIIGPLELVAAGVMASESEKVYPVTAKAMCQTEVIELSRAHFDEHWKKHPSLYQYVLEQMAKRMKRIQDDKNVQRLHLDQKLAYYLTEKVSQIPDLRMTRQDLADAVGSSNESVIRVLSDWTKQKIISTQHQEIKIHDFERLKSIWNKD